MAISTTEQTAVKRPATNGHVPSPTAPSAAAPDQTPKPTRMVGADQRRAEIMIAALFVGTGIVAILGGSFLKPILSAPDYLARVFPNKGVVELGSLLWAINNIGIVFIAVFALRVLRKRDEALATGYLAVTIVEGALMMVGVAATLLLIPLSEAFLKAGAPQDSGFLALGDMLLRAKYLGLTGLSLPLLGLAGSLFTWVLFRHRLVPRAISVLGVLGYALVLLSGIGAWFDVINPELGGNGFLLAIPVALFEIIVLPPWLVFKGFNTTEAPDRSVAPTNT